MNTKDTNTVTKIVSSRIRKSEKKIISGLGSIDRALVAFRNNNNIKQRLAEKDFEKKISSISDKLRKETRTLHEALQHATDALYDYVAKLDREYKDKAASDKANYDKRLGLLKKKVDSVQSKDEDSVAELQKELSSLRKELSRTNNRIDAGKKEEAKSLSLLKESFRKQLAGHKEQHQKELSDMNSIISELQGSLIENTESIRTELDSKIKDSVKNLHRAIQKQSEKDRAMNNVSFGEIGNQISQLHGLLEEQGAQLETEFGKRLADSINELHSTFEEVSEKDRSDNAAALEGARQKMRELQTHLNREIDSTKKELGGVITDSMRTVHASFSDRLKKDRAQNELSFAEVENQISQLKGEAVEQKNSLGKDIDSAKSDLMAENKRLGKELLNFQSIVRKDYTKNVELRKTINAMQKDIDQRLSVVSKVQEDTRNTYTTQKLLEANMKELKELLAAELEKLSSSQDDIKDIYATKEYANKLASEQSRLSKARDQSLNTALESQKQKTITEHKRLKKMSEDLSLLTTEHKEQVGSINSELSKVSETVDKNYLELSAGIATESKMLNETLVKELQSHKNNLDQKLGDFKKKEIALIMQYKNELKKRVEFTYARLHDALTRLGSTTYKEIKELNKSFSDMVKDISAKQVQDITKIKQMIEKDHDLVKSYIEKNDSEIGKLRKELTKATNDLSQNLERSFSAGLKLVQEGAADSVAKLKDRSETEFAKEMDRIGKAFLDRDREHKESSGQFRKMLTDLQKRFDEYKNTNEKEKTTGFKKLNIEVNMLTDKISNMLKFEDSLRLLNEERIQLMSMLESFTRIKKDINKVEEEKLLQFNDYMKQKAKQFKDIVFQAADIDAMQKVKTRQVKKQKKQVKKAPQVPEEQLSPVEKAQNLRLKKLTQCKDIHDELKFLKNEGLTNAQIIKLYNAEYGEHKVAKAVKALKEQS